MVMPETIKSLALNQKQIDLARVLMRLIENGTLSLVLGPRRIGKTQVIAYVLALAAEVMASTEPARAEGTSPFMYSTAMDIFLELRQSMRPGEAGERKVIERLKRPDVLIIDEIQDRGQTPYEDRILTHLIDARYGELKSTILVGNLLPSAAKEQLGESVWSRLEETGCVFSCDGWPSMKNGVK